MNSAHCVAANSAEQTRILMLLEQVSSIANRSDDPIALLKVIVALTTTYFGFLGGNALVRDGGDGEIELRGCGAAFAADDDANANFVEICNRFSTWGCATIPGRLLLDPVTSCLTELQTLTNFSRHREAVSLGAHTMVAVPILVDGGIVGAFEFFLDTHDVPDQRDLDLLFHIGSEIAPVFRRANRERQLTRDATRDAVTGLPNRTMFELGLKKLFDEAFEAKRPGPTLMVIELSGLKHVRDVAGFQAGDLMLTDITQRIGRLVDEFGAADRLLLHYAHSIMLARIGGDDFAISIDGPDRENLSTEIADAIHHSLRAFDYKRTGGAPISASIGIAHDVGGYASIDQILRDADFAMFKAQIAGTGHSITFDQQMRSNCLATAGIVSELQDAIRNHHFELHYQPIYTLNQRHLVGMEALVRWRRDDGQLVMPNDFIPIAEDSGLISEIGLQALRQACNLASSLAGAIPAPRAPFVSVNVSTLQFLQPDFLEQVRDVIESTGINPTSLVIEITESAAIMDVALSARLLAELRSWGVRVGLDDFGTGYSSLNHLQSLPLDGIKIDKSFVMQQSQDSSNWSIVEAILQMAKALKITVIAEGIETVYQNDRLGELGCLFGQGYYYSPPVSEEKVRALLNGSRN